MGRTGNLCLRCRLGSAATLVALVLANLDMLWPDYFRLDGRLHIANLFILFVVPVLIPESAIIILIIILEIIVSVPAILIIVATLAIRAVPIIAATIFVIAFSVSLQILIICTHIIAVSVL